MKDAKGHGSNAGPGRPIPGHPYHAKTNDELRYIARDASEAGRNAQQMGDERGVSKYADQVADAATVMGYRSRGGASDAPKDVLASGPKSAAAPVHDSMARAAGQSDRSYIAQRLTGNAEKSAGVQRAPGESDASYIKRRIS